MDEEAKKKADTALSQLNENTEVTKDIEAHLIADMLRIESITHELREFKDDTKKRLDKLEGWVIKVVVITGTTLIGTLGTLVFKLLGI